jgi:predicted kinase
VPRLVLLNGLPGSGKSTLARRWAQDHPLTLVLDVDVVRGLLGAWLEERTEAGRLARALALAMARTHLSAGHDVVVPQFLGRAGFADALAGVSAEVGATLVEIALIVSTAEAGRRFAARSAGLTLPHDQDAAVLLERQGGSAALTDLRARLLEVLRERPGTHAVDAEGDLEITYQALRLLLD